MRDVANLAGVSVKTVSRVINDEPGVANDVRERVREAVQRLDYRRDERARSLKSGHTSTRSIGFITTDVSNPFHAEVQRSLEDAAWERGYLLLTGSSDESARREQDLTKLFIERRVAGLLVVASGHSQGHLQAESDLGTPVVLVDRAPPRDLKCDFVATDGYEGARMAVRQMIANGHRRIAFMGNDPAIWTIEQRLEGYIAELRDAGIDINPHLVISRLRGHEDAELGTLRMFNSGNGPTAIFSAQNLLTMGAVRALHRLGSADRVALIGFDDFEFADLLTPGVTVIAQNPRGIGRLAADRLFARLDGDNSEPVEALLAPKMIRRGSGEIGV